MKVALWLVLVAGGCKGFGGDGKFFVWNGTGERVAVELEGGKSDSFGLEPDSGRLFEAASVGDYAITALKLDGRSTRHAFRVESGKATIVNVDAKACFARTDISGMYTPGKDRVRFLEKYPATDVLMLDDIVHVYPGEPAPRERPKSTFAFQRLYSVPCDLIADEGRVLEHVRKQR